MNATDTFLRARDFLVARREDYEAAYRGFAWPRLTRFNWAIDYFDEYARDNARAGLWIVDDAGGDARHSFAELSERSTRVANFLRARGAERGDRLLLMLNNVAVLWETMLAAMKLGVVVIPATTQLTPRDLADRFERGRVRHVVTDPGGAEKLAAIPGDYTRLVAGDGERVAGWTPFADAYAAPARAPAAGETNADDPMLLYFTSGTTARPKLVLHTHQSYPVGHLSTLYWVGVREGDVHLNVSSPGWAKHAWSSFFAPWSAGATIFVYNYARFDARRTLETIAGRGVTTLCAPPTVWRMLVGEDLAAHRVALREVVSAGEPLNPEVIERVRRAWGLVIRDGYGQTETTAIVGNSPGQPIIPGSMGRPLPGYRVALVDPEGHEGDEGEISLRLDPRPLGLMVGYLDDPARTAEVTRGGFYRTGDVAVRDESGFVTYVGRADDVFKSSDYRISPFELESAMVEYAAIAEAAVVPAPHPVRLSVPKAYLLLRPGHEPSRELALEIFQFVRGRLASYKRVRRIEFSELPKTISGKIRRVELRARERDRETRGERGAYEYHEEDFPELKEQRA